MIRTTVEALGGAQAVPSELIPARELHQHLINQVATGTGNVVLADTAGKPAPQRDGYALFRARYDAQGCLVEKSFHGPDERPVVIKLGFALLRSKCDEQGREIERAHFGVSGEPVSTREGFSSYRARYDARGNEIERAFFGTDGQPARNAGGAAIVRSPAAQSHG